VALANLRYINALNNNTVVSYFHHNLQHHRTITSDAASGAAKIWRWGGALGVWGTEVPQRGPGAELIAVIKDIWLSNHAQLYVFSLTAQPGIFL